MTQNLYMWQCSVEIEYSSVTYFYRITVFKALYIPLNFNQGRGLNTLYKCSSHQGNYTLCASPALNKRSEIPHFEPRNAIEICDGNNIRYLDVIATYYTHVLHYTCSLA